METRRRLMMGMANKIQIVDTTFTVPANSVRNAEKLYNLLKQEYADASIMLEINLVGAPTANNQFVRFKYDFVYWTYSASRFRDGTIGSFVWTKMAYDIALIEGTQYSVRYLKGVE